MVTRFESTANDPLGGRFTADLETAQLAAALVAAGGLPTERARALLRDVYRAWFNASAAGICDAAFTGVLQWEPDGGGYRFIWYTHGGLACPLARVYPQENGTWASLVVAGVKDDVSEALAQAEWAISRLTSD